MGVAQNYRARVTKVLVFGSIYQGAILVHVFEPQPHEEGERVPFGWGSWMASGPGSAQTRKTNRSSGWGALAASPRSELRLALGIVPTGPADLTEVWICLATTAARTDPRRFTEFGKKVVKECLLRKASKRSRLLVEPCQP